MSPEVLEVGAADAVEEDEVVEAVGEVVKWTVIKAGSVWVWRRSIVMGTAGLWNFRRTSSWRQNLLEGDMLVAAGGRVEAIECVWK